MDSDSSKRKKKKLTKKGKNANSHTSDFFQPSWVRCPISSDNDLDRVILDYGCNFLWYIGLAIWTLFFVIKISG